MGSEYTEAQKRASQKYRKNTDVLQIRCPKGQKEKIKMYANSKGMTMGEFVNRTLNEAMKDI